MFPDERGKVVYTLQQNILTALSRNPSYLAALHEQFSSPHRPKSSSLLGAEVSFVTPEHQRITVAQRAGARITNGCVVATRRMKVAVEDLGDSGNSDTLFLTARYAIDDRHTFLPTSFHEGEISHMHNGEPVFSGRASDLTVETATQKLTPILRPENKKELPSPQDLGKKAFALQERLIEVTRSCPAERKDGFGKSFGSHAPTAQEGACHGSVWVNGTDRVQIEYLLERLSPHTVDNLAFSRVLIITLSKVGLDISTQNGEAIVLTSGYRLDPITHEVLEFTSGEFTVWNIDHYGDTSPKTDPDAITKVYDILKPMLSLQTAAHPQETPAQ